MPKRPNDRGRGWLAGPRLLLLVVTGLLALSWLTTPSSPGQAVRYGEFKRLLGLPGVAFRNVKVSRAEVRGELYTRDPVSGLDDLKGAEPSGVAHLPMLPSVAVPFRTVRHGLELDETFQRELDRAVGAGYTGEEEDMAMKGLSALLNTVLLVGLMLIGTLFIVRWLAGGSGGPLSFGRSRHKLYAKKEQHKTTFTDVAGIDEAVAELREVVDFLQRPAKYQALGGRIPKGVLLVGPPGTGKTLLAKAVAGEAGVPFFSMSGSDFVEMFVGVGAARVRDLFREAESKAPCIIFIDELDALGKSRGGVTVGGHDEREQTLNALLVEMDGFESNRGVIIMAATNRPETLDSALLRPGRFDRTVVVDRPDIDGREAILKVHSRNIKLSDDVNLRRVASLTPGSVGADLANLVNEAALLAARKDQEQVRMTDFNEAVEREAVGLERKSRIMTAEEKQRVAYHESGHALVACSLPGTDPVHKVSIIPRGVGALGYVLSRPTEDRYLLTRTALENKIRVALGGTMAEELVYGDISNGATSDLNQATSIARSMVKEFGMSNLGRVYLRDGEGSRFLPGLSDGAREHSEQTAREVDLEVRAILDAATGDVRLILQRRRRALESLSARLVEKEVIDDSELKALLEAADIHVEETTRNGVHGVAAAADAVPVT